jgi:hypothetical protein
MKCCYCLWNDILAVETASNVLVLPVEAVALPLI